MIQVQQSVGNILQRIFSRGRTINAGPSDEIGSRFVNHFKEIGGLNETDSILDVGSGYGRMAKALTTFLDAEAKYEGIEIIKKGVKRSSKEISSQYPNFHFQHIDVYNRRYNPGGSTSAADFAFPFNDESFDFVFLTSVFTHMLPEDLSNYLKEISRVLRKGGRCFITYFILNEEVRRLVRRGSSHFKLPFEFENYCVESEKDPEHVVAFEEEWITDRYRENQLEIEQVRYGNWSGRADFLDFQDILVARKA